MKLSLPSVPAIAVAGTLLFTPALSAQTKEPAPLRSFIAADCELLLSMQEGEGAREWPYEGVYRTNEDDRQRVIPIGYRVGGTAIVGRALLEAPGYETDEARMKAVAKALAFVLEALERPLMQPTTEDHYDVRGWGHVYALDWLLRLQRARAVPEDHVKEVAKACNWLVDALQTSEIRASGGWNYANHRSASPFMTAPAVRALLAARQSGLEIDQECIERALNALERGRAAAGSIAYSTPAESRNEVAEEQLRFMDKLPGAMGRMLTTEVALLDAGRGDPERLQAAVDAFFEHWQELEKRRQQTGTHIRPYGVAPYYFMYAHLYAAEAIARLDGDDREKARAKLEQLLLDVREEDGGWNDRVFPRSRNYGTAMGILAVLTLSEQTDESDGRGQRKDG